MSPGASMTADREEKGDRAGVRRFRVRSPDVRAVQLTGDADWEAIADWCGGQLVDREQGDSGEYETVLLIPSQSGMPLHDGRIGDWVVLGVTGLFFACSSERFTSDYLSSAQPGGS